MQWPGPAKKSPKPNRLPWRSGGCGLWMPNRWTRYSRTVREVGEWTERGTGDISCFQPAREAKKHRRLASWQRKS